MPRPRLQVLLDGGLRAGRRLTLIAAPAGYGKTTLAVDWIRQASLAAIWLTLDAHDNDLGQLLRYLRLAMARLGPELGRRLHAALEAPALPPLAELVAALLHDLEDAAQQVAAPESGRLLLALDDCHKLEQPAVHAWLALLVEHLPPACHLLLLSREDPPLPLPRLRARGELTELRAQDLRFTVAEAAQFFAEAMQLSLPPAWVAALEARTEGWAAAPQLVDQLLDASGLGLAPARGMPPGPDALSEQELRVLRLMVAGHSNQEIAAALVISVGTAKWHVHNILQKLEVANRPKAIARARELGLA